MHSHFKPTETFQYTHYSSCHPPEISEGLIKGEALRLLRTNSSKSAFEEKIRNFIDRLRMRGYPHILSEVKFTERESDLQQRQKTQNKPLPFVTQYHPSVADLQRIFMGKWHWIENQPLLSEIYKEPPFISYRKGKSLKDIRVRAKL